MSVKLPNPKAPRWVCQDTEISGVIFGYFAGSAVASLVAIVLSAFAVSIVPQWTFEDTSPGGPVVVCIALWFVVWTLSAVILPRTRYKPYEFDTYDHRDVFIDYESMSSDKKSALSTAYAAFMTCDSRDWGEFTDARDTFKKTSRAYDERERLIRQLSAPAYTVEAKSELKQLTSEVENLRKFGTLHNPHE